jgi:hypothetical protein
MLYVSLVLCGILLVLANLTAWRPRWCPPWIFLVSGCGFAVCSAGLMVRWPPVWLEFVLLGGGLWLCAARGWGPRVFVPAPSRVVRNQTGTPVGGSGPHAPRARFPHAECGLLGEKSGRKAPCDDRLGGQ